MAIAKKDRFINKDMGLEITLCSPSFPPAEVEIPSVESKLILLGKSNKTDLMPTENLDDLQYSFQTGNIGQFIYTSKNGDLYELCMYVDEVEKTILQGVRTRFLP